MEATDTDADTLAGVAGASPRSTVDDASSAYLVHYRWEWFARATWRPEFRERKRRSTRAFLSAVRRFGLDGEPVLDASCGLGLRTIVLAEAGLLVHGTDRCDVAVRCAKRLAAEEGHPEIPFHVASWESLGPQMRGRFASAYTDGMWDVASEEAMREVLDGLCSALRPGGILAYEGAEPGGSRREEDAIELEWNHRTCSSGRFSLGLTAFRGRTTVTEVKVLERGERWLDQHHLFVISEGEAARLDQARMRHHFLQWSGKKMGALLEAAGFRCVDWIPGDLQNDGIRDVVVAQRT